MNFRNAFTSVMAARGYSQRALAEQVGTQQPNVARMLKRDAVPLDKVCEYLAAMGYEVAFVPVGTRLPDACYVIGGER